MRKLFMLLKGVLNGALILVGVGFVIAVFMFSGVILSIIGTGALIAIVVVIVIAGVRELIAED